MRRLIPSFPLNVVYINCYNGSMSAPQKTQKVKVPAWTTVEQTIERAKAEILADAASGIVPRTCASFSELHDFVDANGYGGAFEQGFNNEETDFWNSIQDALDAWIKGGGLNA